MRTNDKKVDVRDSARERLARAEHAELQALAMAAAAKSAREDAEKELSRRRLPPLELSWLGAAIPENRGSAPQRVRDWHPKNTG